jgi:hypothetical protein
MALPLRSSVLSIDGPHPLLGVSLSGWHAHRESLIEVAKLFIGQMNIQGPDILFPNLVARITWSRHSRMARPTSSSFFPTPYVSAVSRRVTPSESARWIVAMDSASATELVGDRHHLTRRQRIAIARCACSREAKERRQGHRVGLAQLRGQELWLVRRMVPGKRVVMNGSNHLQESQGITDPEGRRASPSVGALYPLEVLLAAGGQEELPAGVYRYRPQGHGLIPVVQGDQRAKLAAAALEQDWLKDAPAGCGQDGERSARSNPSTHGVGA